VAIINDDLEFQNSFPSYIKYSPRSNALHKFETANKDHEKSIMSEKHREIAVNSKEMYKKMTAKEGHNRCLMCLLPRPCRHHEYELFRKDLSEDELEKEEIRKLRSPKAFRRPKDLPESFGEAVSLKP